MGIGMFVQNIKLVAAEVSRIDGTTQIAQNCTTSESFHVGCEINTELLLLLENYRPQTILNGKSVELLRKRLFGSSHKMLCRS